MYQNTAKLLTHPRIKIPHLNLSFYEIKKNQISHLCILLDKRKKNQFFNLQKCSSQVITSAYPKEERQLFLILFPLSIIPFSFVGRNIKLVYISDFVLLSTKEQIINNCQLFIYPTSLLWAGYNIVIF